MGSRRVKSSKSVVEEHVAVESIPGVGVQTDVRDECVQVDKSKADTLKGPVAIGGRLCFSPYDLQRYELHRFKLLTMKQEIEILRYERQQLELKFREEMAAKKSREEQAARILVAQEKEFEELRQEIGRLYNLNVDELSYDMHSGRIRVKGKDILS